MSCTKTEYRVTFTVEVDMPVWAYSERGAGRIVDEACALNWENYKIISIEIDDNECNKTHITYDYTRYGSCGTLSSD